MRTLSAYIGRTSCIAPLPQVSAVASSSSTLQFDFGSSGALVFPSIPVRSVALDVACGGQCSGAVPTAAFGFPTGQVVEVYVESAQAGVQVQITATVDQSRHTYLVQQ